MGKFYSALVQMLGTRSVIERLTQFLVILAENHSRPEGGRLVIDRKLPHDQIATMVGADIGAPPRSSRETRPRNQERYIYFRNAAADSVGLRLRSNGATKRPRLSIRYISALWSML